MSKVVELRDKVKSVTKIYKMSEAMQVAAMAQLKKIQSRQKAASHYKKHYDRLAARLGVAARVLPAAAQPGVLLYVLTSARGFCGGFNERLVPEMIGFSKKQKERGREVELAVLGGKGGELCRDRVLAGICGRIQSESELNFNIIAQKSREIYGRYRQGQLAEVYVLFNEFKSMLLQTPRFLRLLPFELSAFSVSSNRLAILEPSLEAVREHLEKNYLKILFYDALMQSRLGEVTSRLLTMRQATENSKEMIRALRIKLNKARQAMITFELSEIISSFEILNEEEG